MPYFCIDPANGNDTTGASNASQATAETTPYKTISGVEADSPAAGDFILFNGGDFQTSSHVLASGIDGASGSPITFGSYGTGRGGIDGSSASHILSTGSNEYLTFDNIEIKGGDDTTGIDGLYITAASDATQVNVIVKNSYFHHISEGTEAGGTGQGLDIRAANAEIVDTIISDVPDDGIYIEGDNVEIHHCNISRVDLSATIKSGDCVKTSSTGTAHNAHIHHNILDHSNNSRKQAIIMSGSGTGAIAEHNKCIGGEFSASIKSPSIRFRRNLLQPSHPDHNGNGDVSVTITKGINVEGTASIIESNIIDTTVEGVATGKENTNYGIQMVTVVGTHTIQGNVLYGPLAITNSTNAHIRANNGTNHIIRNNIIGRGDGSANLHHISMGASADLAYCDYNIYLEDGAFNYQGTPYANLAAWQAGTGFDTHSVIVSADTLFRDAANGDFRIKSGQEVAGVQLNYRDFLGQVNSPTIIGAYIQQAMIASSDSVVANAAGSVTSTAGSVSSGAIVGGKSVYSDAVKYPEWGVRA